MENKKENKQRYVCFKRTKQGDEILMDVVSTLAQVVEYMQPFMIYTDTDEMIRIMTYDAYKEWNPSKDKVSDLTGFYCKKKDCTLLANKKVIMNNETSIYYCNEHFFQNYSLQNSGGLVVERWNGLTWEYYTTAKPK